MAVLEITDQTSPSWKTFFICILVGLILGSGLGWWAHHTYTDSDWREKLAALKLEFLAEKNKLLGEISGLKLLSVEQGKEIIRAKAEVRTVSSVEYVDKLVYVDPVTGKQTKEKTDVEITSVPPQKIGLKFNGKDYDIPLRPGETHKFDSGKLVVTQSMSGNINIETKVRRGMTLDLVGQGGAESIGLETPKGFARAMIELRIPIIK